MQLEELNEEQKKAVLVNNRAVLVVAGAGSGKTKTIIHKAFYLIQNGMIDPDRLLMITFTNKAADEIKSRIKKYNSKVDIPWIGTFHSIALKIIRKYHHIFGLTEDFRTLDEDEAFALFQTIISNDPDYTQKSKQNELFEYISNIIEGLIDIKAIKNRKIQTYTNEFLNIMVKQNMINFSFLIGKVKELFENRPDIADYYKNYFDYIIIDEFQDTNTAQYEIVKHIAKKNNICVIGDPNQCIYEWRMAHPENIIKFTQDFNPEVIKLGTNYRSTSAILNLANDILQHSQADWKHLIPILTSSKTEESNIKPLVLAYKDELEEASSIANKILTLQNKVPYNEIAVLVRTTSITRAIERALARKNIPYVIIGALGFFQRKEVKDILSYLYLAFNLKDSIAFKRAVEIPRRGIGDKTVLQVIQTSQEKNIDLLEALLQVHNTPQAQHFVNIINNLRKNIEEKPHELHNHTKTMIEQLDYFGYLKNECKTHEEFINRVENTYELMRFFEQSELDAKQILQSISLFEVNKEKHKNKDAVKIMTIHKSKGLEFEVVFLPRVDYDILPHKRSVGLREIEEERRLFYVAVTRAKKYLFISYTNIISQFLREINTKLYNRFDNKRQ